MAKFGANALFYVIRGNIKKAVIALVAAGYNASINSQYHQQYTDMVYVLKHDFGNFEDCEDMNSDDELCRIMD